MLGDSLVEHQTAGNLGKATNHGSGEQYRPLLDGLSVVGQSTVVPTRVAVVVELLREVSEPLPRQPELVVVLHTITHAVDAHQSPRRSLAVVRISGI